MNILSCAVVATFLTGAAHAATISQTLPLGGFDPYYSQLYLPLQEFNPALGTPTSVTVSTHIVMSDNVVLTPLNPALPVSPLETFTTHFELDLTGYSTPPYHLIDTGTAKVLLTSDINNVFTATVQSGFQDSVTLPLTGAETLNNAVFSIYATPTGNIGFAFDGASTVTAGGLLTITYTYTPVPEPMSLAFLAVGLTGVLAIRRKAALPSPLNS